MWRNLFLCPGELCFRKITSKRPRVHVLVEGEIEIEGQMREKERERELNFGGIHPHDCEGLVSLKPTRQASELEAQAAFPCCGCQPEFFHEAFSGWPCTS